MKRGEHEIDTMLERLSDSSVPPPPETVEQNVLRRIRQAAPDQGDWRPTFWPRWIANPAFGLGLALISAAIGILFTSLVDGEQVVADGANIAPLEIFSDHAPGMLSPER